MRSVTNYDSHLWDPAKKSQKTNGDFWRGILALLVIGFIIAFICAVIFGSNSSSPTTAATTSSNSCSYWQDQALAIVNYDPSSASNTELIASARVVVAHEDCFDPTITNNAETVVRYYG